MKIAPLLTRLLPGSKRHRSLRRQLMSYLGLVWLVAIAAIGTGVISFVHRTEGEAWRSRQSEAARAAAGTVADFLTRATDALVAIGVMGIDELSDRPRLMDELLRLNPALMEVVYLDAGGRVVAGAAQDRPVLAYMFTIPVSQWFQTARAGQPYYGSVQSSYHDEPYLILAVPAPGNGVIASRLKMEVLWRVVSDIRFGRSGRAYVATGTGEVVAHTDRDVVLANTNIASLPGLASVRQNPGQEWHGSYTDWQGVPVVGVTAPVPGTDWLVVTELPQAEAFAASRTGGYLLGAFMVTLGLLVMLVSRSYLARTIFQPMEELRAGTVRIGEGNLDFRMGSTRDDEVGQVARAFDAMAANLSQRNHDLAVKTDALLSEVGERRRAEEALRALNEELECRVRDRTAELAAANETLRASEERYRAVVNDLPVLVARFFPDGILTFVNQQYGTYFGRQPDDLIGQNFLQFIPAADRQAVLDQFSRLNADQPMVTYEHQVVASDGSVRWQQWTDRALFDDLGRTVEYQSVGQDVTERKLAEQQIRASLREKEALLKEIHHRVKNNLQVISSLLALQASHLPDAASREMFQDSQSRIRSMALIHERLYQSPDLSSIDFCRYVDGLVSELFRSYGARATAVTPQVEVEQVSLSVDVAIPCSLVINELVSNALKHAFPDGRAGRVCVRLEREQGRYRLVIADDGVGFPPGIDVYSTPSLGLQLVITLVEQLHGTISLSRNGGTEFQIAFPAPG